QRYASQGYPQNQDVPSNDNLQYPRSRQLVEESVMMSESEPSISGHQGPGPLPPGFNYEERKPQGRRGRGPGVLQKSNRRFTDAYEHEQDQGYGGGYSAGSSSAARKVMDFFRRRGRARGGDER